MLLFSTTDSLTLDFASQILTLKVKHLGSALSLDVTVLQSSGILFLLTRPHLVLPCLQNCVEDSPELQTVPQQPVSGSVFFVVGHNTLTFLPFLTPVLFHYKLLAMTSLCDLNIWSLTNVKLWLL